MMRGLKGTAIRTEKYMLSGRRLRRLLGQRMKLKLKGPETMTKISMDPRDIAKELGPAADAQIGAFMAVASIALNMATKYHDINTVQDGTLYQQYKIEGRNIQELHLDMVFETAIRIEEHLVKAHERISGLLLSVLVNMDDESGTHVADNADEPKSTE
jgi:hypothetical protein